MSYIGRWNKNSLNIEVYVSDMAGVGFDWTDLDFQKAVRERDPRLWEILDWMAFGGGEIYDKCAEFEDRSRFSGQALRMLKEEYTVSELQAMLDSGFLDERSEQLIRAFFSGTAHEMLQEEIVAKQMRNKVQKKSGYVYLLLAENGLYKIGKARDISARLQPFTVHFPMKWELVHSFKSDDYTKAEERLHTQFAATRDIGEWFRLTPADVEYIKAIQDGQL
jgi:hypothetical protein